MTSKKRKYGDLSARQPPTSDPSLLDDVFAAFTGKRPVVDEQAEGLLISTAGPVPDQTRTAPVPVPKTSQTSTKPVPATAPERDFNRRANSLEREALPAGLFPGSSKKIYDALYFRTRGAVKPVRTIQATRRDIMQWTGIKNVKTIHDHTRRLIGAGLIHVSKIAGDHEGSVYEVFLPEEANQYQTHTSTAPEPRPSGNMVLDPDQKMVRVGMGNLIENKHTSADPKTFIKTNTESDDDDAALAELNAALKQAAKELTGKDVSPAESARWRELAEVLITEAKIAGARTTVSSFPAFLAEHLRRRLWKKDKNQLESEGRTEAKQTPAAPSLTEEQIKSCPDCGGSTWYYPEGPEKGIKRCRHEKI